MCASLSEGAHGDLPAGFSIRALRVYEYEAWRALHLADAPLAERDAYIAVVDGFFREVYAPKGDAFYERCRVACDPAGKIVGTCMMWKAYGDFSTLHWLRVLPAYEGRGLGRALLWQTLSELGADAYPVYLHTHPHCDRAIKLYSDFGFRLLTDEKVGARENDLREALPILKERMPPHAFAQLAFSRAGADFLRAARASQIDEF